MKRYIQITMLLLVLCTMFLTSCSDKATEVHIPAIITVTNNTRLTVNRVMLSNTGSEENEVVYTNTITPGTSAKITLPHSYTDGRYDISIYPSNAQASGTFMKRNVQLDAGGNTLQFTDNDHHGIILWIMNNTGSSISTIAIRRQETTNWIVSNLTYPIANYGTNYTYYSPTVVEGIYDVQLRTSTGTTYTRTNIPLRFGENELVSFYSTNIDQIVFTIMNSTGVTTNGVYIRRNGTSTWSGNLSSTNLTSGNTRQITLATSYTAGDYDIQLRTSTGSTFTRTAVPLAFGSNPTVAFVSSDFDNPIRISYTNNTGVPTNTVWVTLTNTSNWYAVPQSAVNVANGGTSPTFTLPASYNAGRYDVLIQEAEVAGQPYPDTAFTLRNTQLNFGTNSLTFSAANATNVRMTITNNTGVSISGVYYRRTGVATWSGNQITTPIAYGTTSSVISLSFTNLPGNYDLQLRTNTGVNYTKMNVSLIAGTNSVTFLSSDIDPITVVITNNTNWSDVGYGIYVRPVGTTVWGTNYSSSNIAIGASRTILLPNSYAPGLYDIQVRSDNNVNYTFTKTNVQLNSGSNSVSISRTDYDNIYVHFYNNTASTAVGIYRRPSGTTTWNSISSNSIASGSSRGIYFNSSVASGYYDLRIGSVNNVKYNVLLTKGVNTYVYFP